MKNNLVNQKLISTLLQRAGHNVTIANNGREVLDFHHRDTFDLILMDVHMPEIDGEQATKAIRAGDVLPEIPIVAVTANALMGDKERFIDMGMNGYISKPINTAELFDIVNSLTRKEKQG